jgi:enamine deaminase RidA (YjgF/YER057c/UK114 family)
MRTVLRAAGSDLQHIIKANIYLSDMKSDFVPMNEAYAEVRKIFRRRNREHEAKRTLNASSFRVILPRGRA